MNKLCDGVIMTFENELRNALVNLYSNCPSYVNCSILHHTAKDRHDFNELCPVERRYNEALEEARRVLLLK